MRRLAPAWGEELGPGGQPPGLFLGCASPAYNPPVDTTDLPGAELVRQGLLDLASGLESVAALLVTIGAPRLTRLGFEIPASRGGGLAEHRLYHLLAREDPDSAHGRYNALIRRLVSFERAAECAHWSIPAASAVATASLPR